MHLVSPRRGRLTVVMNVTGSLPAAVRINVAATLPTLAWIGAGLLIGASLPVVAAVVLIAIRAPHGPGHAETPGA